MSRQTYFIGPKFNKKSIYNSPVNKYQEFTNAYIYSTMVKIGNSTPNYAIVCHEAATEWTKIKNKSATEIDNIIKEYITTPIHPYNIPTIRANRPKPILETVSPLLIISPVEPILEISKNATAQRKIVKEIKITEEKLVELKQIYNITTDTQIQHDIYIKIEKAKSEISSNKDKINKLKRNVKYTQNCRAKKFKILTENQEVVQYDKSGRPLLLFEHPDLHDQIHDSVEFGSANSKR